MALTWLETREILNLMDLKYYWEIFGRFNLKVES